MRAPRGSRLPRYKSQVSLLYTYVAQTQASGIIAPDAILSATGQRVGKKGQTAEIYGST